MKNSFYSLSLLFISAALLSFEISLMRMLRVEGFGNFTYGAIALALIGFGASGTFLSLFSKRITGRETKLSYWTVVLFIFFLCLSFYASKKIQFDALRILWDRNQVYRLLFRYLFYTIPFIIGSSFIVLAFVNGKPGKIYFFNLLGSGIGIFSILISFYFLSPGRILIVPLSFAIVSLILYSIWSPSPRKKHLAAIPFLVGGIILFLFGGIKILPFKGRELALNLPDARIIEKRVSPFGSVEVIESAKLRIAPGLSLAFRGKLPQQHGLYIDGDLLSAIDRIEDSISMDYLHYQIESAVYAFHERPDVFIIGLGGGISAERAFIGGARRITVSEENPFLPHMLRETFRLFNGGFFREENIHMTSVGGRSYLRALEERPNIIEIGEDRTISSIGGIYSTDTNFLLTVEAVRDYLESIEDNGTVSLTVSLKQPPRHLPKLVAIAVEALKGMGIPHEQSIVVIRSWSSGTVLLKKVPFREAELTSIRNFCEKMLFDLVYYSGIREVEANRYNIVEDAAYFRIVQPIIKNDRTFIKDYVFNIKPATDDRPYFSYFIRIGKMGHLFSQTGKKWLFVVEGGYIVLFVTASVTIVLSSILILLPTFFWGQKVKTSRVRVLLYFSCIAVGFMFVEILLMQKYRQYLANPLVACGFLSLYFTALIFFLDGFLLRIAGISKIWQLIIPALSTAPLGLAMGLFFPLGISIVKQADVFSLPWAWSVNGFFSVIASSGTVLIASNIGLLSTGGIALFCYWMALLSFPE
jgi:hypothetical protein